MRRRLVLVGLAAALVVGAVAGQAVLGSSRQSAYARAAAQLDALWRQDAANGLPQSVIAPLRARLEAAPAPSWWSTDWWQDTPDQLVDELRSQTQDAWQSALGGGRADASSVLSQASALVTSAGTSAPAPFVAEVATWSAQIGAAASPAKLASLASSYRAALDDAREKVREAQARAAEVAAEAAAAEAHAAALRVYGGAGGLLDAVAALDATAAADNLDVSAVDGLAAQLRYQATSGQDATATAARLSAAITAFRDVVAVNDEIAKDMQPLHWEIEQSVVEGTPNSASFVAQFDPIQKAFPSARTAADIDGVRQQQVALRGLVDAELAASTCGHAVAPGKVLVISLSAQEMVAYQDGCAVRATPVTTGRPQLPTPPGDYHIFYKTAPFTMVSPWPYGSPFWYPTTRVAQVMEFLQGGYFIHDASWEAPGDYGPGSEDNPNAASHGCVHIPTPTMQWLYQWTPVGTEVIVER